MLGIEVNSMEIGKVYQVPGLIGTNAQSNPNPQVGDKTKVADVVSKDFQVDLHDGFIIKLAEFANILQNREQLLQSLPEDIRKTVVELLGQMAADTELPQGLEHLLKGQKNTIEQLKDMSTILNFSGLMNKEDNNEIKSFLQTTYENFTQHTKRPPEQLAKELVQLAKQLWVSTTVPQGKFQQTVEQLFQQTLPENMQQLSTNEQKVLVTLTKLLGQDMPVPSQQLAQQNDLPELPTTWGTLKASEAWPFKDIQPKVLQTTADFLQQIAQEMSPGKEAVVTSVPQGKFQQTVEQPFQQTLPENMQQLSTNEQKVVVTLTKLSGQDMPVPLQQLAQQNNLSELPTTWGTLKASDAWPIKDIQPKTLQTAADLFQQIVQEISPGKEAVVTSLEKLVQPLYPEINNKGTIGAQLEQLIKILPPEMGKALQKVLQQDNIPEKLLSLANTFSDATVLNKNMTNDMKSLLAKMSETFASNDTSTLVETSTILSGLSKQSMDTSKIIEQLKIFTNQLKTQLFTGDPALSNKEQHDLDQITKLFEPNIPQVLQEGAVTSKLPQLPKIWAMLTALGAQQWLEMESHDLHKSADVVKELAQSIYKLTGLVGEKQVEHSTLSFSIPFQVAEGIYYPVHIHIYHEQKDSNSSSPLTQREFETWLRVCVDTENLGRVDNVFRLYGDNKLDVRVNFPSTFAADQFTENISEVRKSLENSKLKLTDVTVGKV